MTGHPFDTLDYEGSLFDIQAYEGENLEHAEYPKYSERDTDHYVCRDGILYLDAVRRLYDDGTAEEVDGLALDVPFTGGLLVAKDFSSEWTSRTDYAPWQYATVLELRFDAGQLIDVIDHSSRAAELQTLVRISLSETWAANPPVPIEFIEDQYLPYSLGFYQGQAHLWRKKAI
jgi:hypothetical protein